MYPNLFFNKNKFWPHFHAADLSSHWLILCLYLNFIYFTKIYISSLQTLLLACSSLLRTKDWELLKSYNRVNLFVISIDIRCAAMTVPGTVHVRQTLHQPPSVVPLDSAQGDRVVTPCDQNTLTS